MNADTCNTRKCLPIATLMRVMRRKCEGHDALNDGVRTQGTQQHKRDADDADESCVQLAGERVT